MHYPCNWGKVPLLLVFDRLVAGVISEARFLPDWSEVKLLLVAPLLILMLSHCVHEVASFYLTLLSLRPVLVEQVALLGAFKERAGRRGLIIAACFAHMPVAALLHFVGGRQVEGQRLADGRVVNFHELVECVCVG